MVISMKHELNRDMGSCLLLSMIVVGRILSFVIPNRTIFHMNIIDIEHFCRGLEPHYCCTAVVIVSGHMLVCEYVSFIRGLDLITISRSISST